MTAISELRSVVMKYSGWLLGVQLRVDAEPQDDHSNGGATSRPRLQTADADHDDSCYRKPDSIREEQVPHSFIQGHLQSRWSSVDLPSRSISEGESSDPVKSGKSAQNAGGPHNRLQRLGSLESHLQGRIQPTSDFHQSQHRVESRLHASALRDNGLPDAASLGDSLFTLDSRKDYYFSRQSQDEPFSTFRSRQDLFDTQVSSIGSSMSTGTTTTPDTDVTHYSDSDRGSPSPIMDLSSGSRREFQSRHGNGTGHDNDNGRRYSS